MGTLQVYNECMNKCVIIQSVNVISVRKNIYAGEGVNYNGFLEHSTVTIISILMKK